MTTIRRVAVVSREFPPDTDWGGAGRYALNLALGLRDAGVEVHVLSQSARGQYDHAVGEGLVVHRFPLVGFGSTGAAAGIAFHDHHYLDVGAWACAVADRYRRLSAVHSFDVVEGSEYTAETLHVDPGPTTLRAVRVFTPMAYVHSLTPGSATAGVRLADAMEGVSVAVADAVSAPSLIAVRMAERVWGREVPARVIPLPYDAPGIVAPRAAAPGEPVRLVFVGRLERRKGPEAAVWTAVHLARAGTPVELTMVGGDVVEGGQSMRDDRLRPLVARHASPLLEVEFAGRLDDDALAEVRRRAHVAVLPSTFESFSYAVCEALGDGCLVVTGDSVGVTEHLSAADGVLPLPAHDPEAFGRAAAALVREGTRPADVERGQRTLTTRLSRRAVVADTLATWEEARDRVLPRPPGPRAVPTANAPAVPVRLGARVAVVVLAHNGLAYTRRCVDSLRRNPAPGMEVVVVDNASTDGTPGWLASQGPPVRAISPGANLGVSGGRNAGIRALDLDALDAVVFLDNDTEVGPGWWEPFQAALDADPSLGIAGEEGYHIELHDAHRHIVPVGGRGPVRCDLVVGYCMYVRPEAIVTTGLYDERLGLFWHDDDDYCLRAELAGWRVAHVGSERVHHYGHVSSSGLAEIWEDAAAARASDLSASNQRYLVDKWRQLGSRPDIEGVAGRYVLVDAGTDPASVDTEATVVAVPLDPGAAGRLPDDTTGVLDRIPTAPAGSGRRITAPVAPAVVARLAFSAEAVVGDPRVWRGWLGGAVRPVRPEEARYGHALRRDLRPWLDTLIAVPA